MSKEFLLEKLSSITPDTYSWSVYFFKIDRRRRGNPYYAYKHTFKNTQYLPTYIDSLIRTIIKYQVEPLESVQEYDGENNKTSCDKLDTSNDLIAEKWNYMRASVAEAPKESISGKYQGYILNGYPLIDDVPPIVITKAGNPIINLDRKNSKVFKHTEEAELEDISDELCRLYLISDFIVIERTLYAFNHKFEGIFGMQKTLQKLKEKAIDEIIETNAFEDHRLAQSFMKGYSSPKTFLTLREQRVEKLNSIEGRGEIAEILKLQISETGIIISEQKQANQLIKYLCYKIFQDKETDNLIEVNSIINDNVLQQS